MSTSPAYRGYKGFIRIGRGATPVWTKLAGVPRFALPSRERPDIDNTHLESPDDQEEAIPGMRPISAWTLELDHVSGSATTVLLQEVEASGETVQIELNVPTSKAATTFDKYTYAGYAKDYVVTVDPKEKMVASVPFTIMGVVAND